MEFPKLSKISKKSRYVDFILFLLNYSNYNLDYFLFFKHFSIGNSLQINVVAEI